MAYAILRINKLTTKANIAGVENHMDRVNETPNADNWLTDNNLDLVENKNALEKFEELTEDIKIRKNAVLAIDVFMGASPQFFKESNQTTIKKWREDSMEWLKTTFGAKNIIRAKFHLDESTPHIQAIVIPKIYDEKKEQYKLSARHYLNGRDKLSQLQTDYHNAVEKYGLERGIEGSRAKHTDIKTFYGALKKQLDKDLPEPNFMESAKKYKERIEWEFKNANLKGLEANLSDKNLKWIEQTAKEYKNALDKTLYAKNSIQMENLNLKAKLNNLNKCLEFNPGLKENLEKAAEKIRKKVAK